MPEWTEDQKKVIEERGTNILVSAAAGSGKTAVLVERIIGKIINEKVEVDKLLVVTFTNAAAKEMKDRIKKAIDKEIAKDPGNEFLLKQNALITGANISTIDSFSGNLVRENFNDIGIDPTFRICDESEEEILFNEACDKVLDRNFEESKEENFIELMNLYTNASDYSNITSLIKGLYRCASAYPWPMEWLDSISQPYTPEENHDIADYALTVIELTRQVILEFDIIKRDKNVATFNDVERYALNILIDPETKEVTKCALELKKTFDEVMVDEYQDINELQEYILSTLSNGSNMFMVGDVKQSIYGFRMANPDIFINKSELFSQDNSKGTLINLKENFRSRPEVLGVVNDIFTNIMTKETSGFDYDDNAKLYFGAKELFNDDIDSVPELIIADPLKSDKKDAMSSREIEASIVAERIRELVDNKYKVKDKDDDGNIIMRDIKYSDIAILLRAANTNGRVYEKALNEYNIPCYASGNVGYFGAVEVKLVLAFLSVVDNPFRDIEIASVLHSPIYNISNDMMAKVRIYGRDNCDSDYLYDNITEYIRAYSNDDANEELTRLIYAMDMIEELRLLVSDTPIHELIRIIYDRTSYLDYVSTLLNGQYKRANLLALYDRALDFEKTGFRGVFRFIKFIDTLKEHELDSGEASILGENDDVVRILTMHKSKGLEFPVVFVSDLGSNMSNRDAKKSNVIHNTLGLGMEIRREVNGNRYKKDSEVKTYIKEQMEKDFKAEEARLLYVATTRAKEKLILTAAIKGAEKKVDNFRKGSMDYETMLNASTRIEWIIRGINSVNPESLDKMLFFKEPASDLEKAVLDFTYINDKKISFEDNLGKVPKDLIDKIEDRLSFEYPYENNDNIKTKYSVSEIKHNKMNEAFSEEAEARPDFLKEEKEKIIPKFISGDKKEKENVGALYGTAMHRVMECFDFNADDYSTSLESQLRVMRDSNLITEEQLGLISREKINNFIESSLAYRMHNASLDGKLYIEKPFVLQENPKALFEDAGDNSDPILIQGIIDVFFEEEDGMILLDYKTDKVTSGEELISRYSAQLDLYAKAIEKYAGIKVKEKILYSFCLEKEVYLY